MRGLAAGGREVHDRAVVASTRRGCPAGRSRRRRPCRCSCAGWTPARVAVLVAGRHDHRGAAGDGAVDGALGGGAAGAAAAEAHVDDLAGVGLAGTPATVPPDAQVIASAMSEVVAAALAERAHRLRSSRRRRCPPTPLAVVGDGGDGAGDVRAVPGGVAARAADAVERRCPVALVGGVAVAAVAVARGGGVADEVVAGDDVGGEVGVRRMPVSMTATVTPLPSAVSQAAGQRSSRRSPRSSATARRSSGRSASSARAVSRGPARRRRPAAARSARRCSSSPAALEGPVVRDQDRLGRRCAARTVSALPARATAATAAFDRGQSRSADEPRARCTSKRVVLAALLDGAVVGLAVALRGGGAAGAADEGRAAPVQVAASRARRGRGGGTGARVLLERGLGASHGRTGRTGLPRAHRARRHLPFARRPPGTYALDVSLRYIAVDGRGRTKGAACSSSPSSACCTSPRCTATSCASGSRPRSAPSARSPTARSTRPCAACASAGWIAEDEGDADVVAGAPRPHRAARQGRLQADRRRQGAARRAARRGRTLGLGGRDLRRALRLLRPDRPRGARAHPRGPAHPAGGAPRGRARPR